ncbi:MAG: N-acetylmuramoyl-L-alanine amidase, partial [Patescibacteria group bacterium]
MKKITFLAVTFAVIVATGNFVAVAETIPNPLANKIIALDAGHGSTDSDFGAQYPAGCADDGNTTDCLIYEKDVNLAVVNALESKLTVLGAKVVIAERFSTRRDRVNDAVAKCAAFDLNNNGIGDKCNVLVSVHHNGSNDQTHDGTLTIYTQKSDKPLAQSLLTALTPLTTKSEGMLNGG